MSERREQPSFPPMERRLIAALEQGLPLVPAPYRELARRLGLDPAWVLATVGRWVREGVIRRLGATVRHHRVGYTFNCMVAWRLEDPSRHREAGERLAEFPEVTHCYRRPPFPGWPYTLYTMVHGGSEQELLGHGPPDGRGRGPGGVPVAAQPAGVEEELGPVLFRRPGG